MISLGKEHSAKVYKHLTNEEIEKITLSITGLDKFDSEIKEEVMSEFHDMCIAQKYISEGGLDYAREILVAAMGEEAADNLLGKISSSLQVRPFDFIRRADTKHIFNFIQNEHPQTIALVMSYLDPQQCGPILAELPMEKQVEVISRLATMGTVSPEYIKEAERILEHKLSSVGLEDSSEIGGIDTIVQILNAVDRTTEKNILEQIEGEDAELADEIHRKMFVFEDIVKLTNPAIQRTLKEVDNDLLALALKGTTPEIEEKIFANVSSRLKETLKENMEFMGPVRVSDVEEAQQKIVNVIRRLEEAGEIQVARGGGADNEFIS
ncbi:MAG: flagellar motor switch protein FliG [Clostridia bacterium]|nr:flagellar motor switch protein FliG [Clostridia bacterium]